MCDSLHYATTEYKRSGHQHNLTKFTIIFIACAARPLSGNYEMSRRCLMHFSFCFYSSIMTTVSAWKLISCLCNANMAKKNIPKTILMPWRFKQTMNWFDWKTMWMADILSDKCIEISMKEKNWYSKEVKTQVYKD